MNAAKRFTDALERLNAAHRDVAGGACALPGTC